MPRTTTASVLIENIKRRASVPENQATFEANDFLSFANEELMLGIVPAIMSLHEDYFLYEIEVPLETNKTEYEIPSRAVGNKLRDLQYKPDANSYVEMTRVGIGDRFGDYNDSMVGDLRRFYVKNNKVVLNSNIGTSTGSLVFIFYIRPAQLVLEERIGVIQGINNLNNGKTELILNDIPENFNTSIKYDLYKAESPNSILKIDLTAQTINTITKSVTFNTVDLPDNLKVGDHLSQAGEATIAQIPDEFHPMLEQMVACRILEAQGDTNGLQSALVKLKQMETAGQVIADNRIDDAPIKIVNRHSLLRSGISRKYNRRQ